MNLSESKEFIVNSGSLKDVRLFSRDVFEKLNIDWKIKKPILSNKDKKGLKLDDVF